MPGRLRQKERDGIPAVIERRAGIDVRKRFLVARCMTGPANATGKAETRQFGTTRSKLESLRRWLESEGCAHAGGGQDRPGYEQFPAVTNFSSWTGRVLALKGNPHSKTAPVKAASGAGLSLLSIRKLIRHRARGLHCASKALAG